MKRIVAAEETNSFEEYVEDALSELDDTYKYIVQGIELLVGGSTSNQNIQEVLSNLRQVFDETVEMIAEYTLEE